MSTATAALLVDPDFRDQFLITAPSARYAAALACVPDEFVGGASRLTALVEFLSGEHRALALDGTANTRRRLALPCRVAAGCILLIAIVALYVSQIG